MSTERWTAYDFAILRVVPHVYLGTYVDIGVVLHARTAGFLGMRAVTAASELQARAPGVDVELLVRYLDTFQAICDGNADAGPVALSPPSERFHWLTAPRSDVLQSSPVHGGLCESPAQTLADLFAAHIGPRGR
jgi:DUF3037 family protein